MNIKNIIPAIGLLVAAVAFNSCDDYFDTDPKNIINEKDYIAEENEMYKGFLGIFNRMQEAGDHAIFLTDTRGPLLETTDNAPAELKSIYYYNETNGNSYADPTCYYAIIVACNDYFAKMADYHHNVGGMTEIAEENFPALISSAIRIKVWAYLMLGKIYGEAYWFDDPLTEKKDLTDGSVFTHCNMKELADRAINLLESGMTIDGIHVPADLEVSWYKWIDEEEQDASLYRYWEYLTPPALVLNAEFRSWRASYVDEAAAQADWQWIHDNILSFMYDYQNGTNERALERLTNTDLQGTSDIFQLNKKMQSDNYGAYQNIFYTDRVGLMTQLLSGIMYDYDNHQRNRLVQYFCPEYPDAESFYLQPSDHGVGLYNESDIRGLTQGWTMRTLGGQRCVSKYYYGYNFTTRAYEYLNNEEIFKIEPTIPTFRAHDLHFLLAEAETHLGHFEQAYWILNQGLSTRFPDKKMPTDDPAWDYRYDPWVSAPNGGYGNLGLAGTASGTIHELPLPTDDDWSSYTEDQLKEMYDWAIADENVKEYIAEGKSYSYMCKIAERYANSAYRSGSQEKARDSVAVRLAPKYAANGRAQKVESAIKTHGYFINWQLSEISGSKADEEASTTPGTDTNQPSTEE